MLLAVVLLITLIAVMLRFRLRVLRADSRGRLGWMSEQWLAQYRGSQVQ